MVRTFVIVLPLQSVKFHVSVTIPPAHATGAAVCVEVTVPATKQAPFPLLVYANVLGPGMAPQATVILVGVDVNSGNGQTVIVTTLLGITQLNLLVGFPVVRVTVAIRRYKVVAV